ncbi:hypothetical protein QBE53_13170 [Vallitaleaceae bacterium 9-2]
MDEKIRYQLFEKLPLSSEKIHQTLKAFSAYLDEFNKDYKYNYKFMVSYIEDFENAMMAHEKYLKKCLRILNNLKKNKILKNEFQKIELSEGKVSFALLFDNVLYCDITKINDEDPVKIIGSVKPHKWERIVKNNDFDIEVTIKLKFQNLELTRRFYEDEKFQNNQQLLTVKFFEDSYKTITEEKIGTERFRNLITLNSILKENYSIKIIVDENMSICFSEGVKSELLGCDSVSFEEMESGDLNKIIISSSKKEYKFDIDNLDNIELIKKKIGDEFLQEEKI